MKCGGEAGGGTQSLLPSSTACLLFFFLFLIIIFDQLSILSRVVNSISCYVSQGIYRPELVRWNFILAKKISVQSLF